MLNALIEFEFDCKIFCVLRQMCTVYSVVRGNQV